MRKILFLEVLVKLKFYNGFFLGEQQDDKDQYPDEPSSPDLLKRTRPSRACDLCRKKKVGNRSD
jgi:hypothetical protein